LIKPPFSIATASAYQAWDRKEWQDSKPVIIDSVHLFNDLEAPVFEKYLLLAVLKEWLQQRAEVITAWMSGSGSTMVALLKKEITETQFAALEKKLLLEFGVQTWIKEVKFSLTS
jgi:4-diphosphocytidyl-2-C-methyl-D-erythritol kinase